MKHYIFLFYVLLAFTAVKNVLSQEEKPKEQPRCECGLFNNQTVKTTNNEPIGSKMLQFEVTCDNSGKENCKNMCRALAETSKHQDGIKRLCEHLGAAVNFVPKLYYKLCNEKNWHFTGGPSTIEVCCKDKMMIPCSAE